jgi:hypothetical protein
VYTTAIAASGTVMGGGLFFLFACCCFAAAGRRAGGMRNKWAGNGPGATFPHGSVYENYQQHERGGMSDPILKMHFPLDDGEKTVGRQGQEELVFTFGIGKNV